MKFEPLKQRITFPAWTIEQGTISGRPGRHTFEQGTVVARGPCALDQRGGELLARSQFVMRLNFFALLQDKIVLRVVISDWILHGFLGFFNCILGLFFLALALRLECIALVVLVFHDEIFFEMVIVLGDVVICEVHGTRIHISQLNYSNLQMIKLNK